MTMNIIYNCRRCHHRNELELAEGAVTGLGLCEVCGTPFNNDAVDFAALDAECEERIAAADDRAERAAENEGFNQR